MRTVYGRSVVMESQRIEFSVLGPLEVRREGKVVPLGAAKQRVLLGVLLLNANVTISVSRLVDELWGERPPATAEKLVQGYVHALRKQVGDGVLATQPPGYRVNVDPESLDLLLFERLADDAQAASIEESIELRRRALTLWRGPVLADLALEGPARNDVARLGELRLTTQIELLDAELQLGRHAQRVGELEGLVAEHPYQERAAALLMLALYRSGRQAEALEAYRALRQRLDDELGLQPNQELRELEAAILRQDPSLSFPPPRAEIAVSDTTAALPAVRTRSRRRLVAAGVLVLLAVAAAAAVAAVVLARDPAPVVVPPNSVAAIDPSTNRVIEFLQTGIRPDPVAAGAGSLWVGNLDDRSLTRIDTASRAVTGTIPLPATPTAIAVGGDAVWVVNGRLGTLYRVDAEFETTTTGDLGERAIRHIGAGVDLGDGWVWTAFGESKLARVDPETLDAAVAPSGGPAPAGLVVAFGHVWVADSGDATVRRFSPATWDLGDVATYPVCAGPRGMADAEGSIWVACTDDDVVARVPGDLSTTSYTPISVDDGPTSVAFGAGSVWVANTAGGTVSRIDPETNEIEATIPVGNAPTGIAMTGGLVWVAVQAP